MDDDTRRTPRLPSLTEPRPRQVRESSDELDLDDLDHVAGGLARPLLEDPGGPVPPDGRLR